MRLIFLFLFAIAAALSSAHAQTPLVFTSNATLPSSPAGSPAAIPVQITGGTPPYSFTLKRGQTLPTGLVLNNSTGVISGTPRGPSSTEIQVQVRDSGAPVRYKAKNFILPISGDAPALPTFKVIPSVAQVDKPFSFTLNATRGKTPYTFTTNSTLPAGLSLSTSGTLSGTPLPAAAPQSATEYKIVVRVVGSNAIPQSSTRTYTLTVAPAAPPSITTKTIPDAEMGEEYLFDDLVVTGGKPPYKFKAAAAFPAGLTIAEDGTISGTPKTAGPYRLRISATDANNRTGTAFVSLIVSDAPTPKITTATTLYWTRNQTVTTTLAATAGRAPYKWAKTGKSTDPLRNLPDGVTLNQNGTFSGTPTVANTFTVPIRVTDDLGKGSIKTFTIIVSTSSLAISSPAILDPAYVGVSPNLNLTAQGGIAPYTWTLKNRGTLPSTITLNSAGRLSGAANATGNFSFTVEVADSRNGTVAKVEKQLTLPVINYNLAISTTSLPAGSAGSNYPATPLVATGGKPPYTWSFTSTPALSGLSASTGNLTGKPAAAGNYTLALKVTDDNSRSVTSNLALRVNEPDALAFDPLTLPNGRVGTSYNGTLGAKGGFSPYTFTLKTGNALPAGLKLATTGVITGTPSTAGTFKFIVVLKDSKKPTAATIEREFTLVIDAYGMSIGGPATITGKRYSSITPAQFTVTGGTANYTWSDTPALPAALNLDSKTGLVSGDLTAAVGNYTVAIKVTDGNRQFATRNLTVNITQPDPVVWVTPATLPEGQVGGNYTAVELAASGGRAPYTYALKTGNRLPSGLALSAGKISGTPRVAGTFKFTLVASDSQTPTKATAEREFTLVIKPAVPLAIAAPNPMPSANVGSVYGPASFTASGGLPPYTWSVTPSPAAPGLTFSGGNLTGTPTTAGNYTFTVRVVDSASANATRTITLPVGALIPLEWVTPSTLPGGQLLTTYNATLTTRGGTAPVTITRISGNLSAGLTQSGTRISGTPTAVGNATFTLQARDKNGVTANRTFTLPVAPYDLSVSADSPSVVNGTVNQPLSSDPFNADGGDGDYTWSISGTKPAWLSINRDSGVLSGTSNATGNWTVNVVVTDGNRQTANKTCTVSIGLGEPPLLDTTQQLPAGMVGVPYPNPAINAEGGLEPYRFTLKNSSSLPAGLSINATTGVISGTPSAAGNTTTTIVVTGANGASAERAYTIRIDAYDLAISSEVPWVLQGQVYKDFGPLPLEATGGLESYNWSMIPASTANLTLDASGTLTGRPATAGNFSVTFRVVDARNATVTKNATIQIAPAAPLEFTTEPNLPNGKVATPYGGDVTILPAPTPVAGVTLAGKGGLAPYTYSFKTGSTPPSGLNLSTAGKISGTPSAAGTFKFFVVIKDAKNTTAEREFTLVVEPYGMIVSGPDTIAGDQYSTITPAAFTAVGGIANYTWSAAWSGNATALTINSGSGIVSGNLTTGTSSLTALPGNYTMIVSLRDGRNQTANKTVAVQIRPRAMSWVTGANLPSGKVSFAYSTNITATGGWGAISYALKSGSVMPGNLTLNSTTGGISGTPITAGNFTFTIVASDSASPTKNMAEREFRLAVSAMDPLAWTITPAPASGKVAFAYTASLSAASGGSGNHIYSANQTTLPPGLSFNASTRTISGTPTTSGNFNVSLTVRDNFGNATANATLANSTVQTIPITIEPYGMSIAVDDSVVITGNQHQPLTPTQFSVTGGRPAYVWSSTPTPPAGGLTLNATTGILSGVPTTAGNTTLAVRVTDGASQTATQNCTIRILPAGNLTITSASSLPSGSMNASYSTTLTASGGKPFLTANQSTYYNWSIANRGNLPANFTLNATTGILSGTANAVLTANFTVSVTDASNAFATKNCSLQITAPLDSGDADGDGVNNYREAYDGTDPFDPKSFNPLSVGLVAHYPFEGNAKDESGNGNNGIAYGGATLTNDQFGRSNSAYFFDGVNDYMDIGNPVGNKPTDFTQSTWVKMLSRTNLECDTLITKRHLDNGSDWTSLCIGSTEYSGSPLVILDDANFNQVAKSPESIELNQWAFICGVKRGSTYLIYVNGVLKESFDNNRQLDGSSLNMHLMHHGAWNRYTNGALDEVRIYNRALSAAEVSQLYSEESGEPNMVLVQGGTLPQGSVLAGQTISAFHIARFETTWAEWKQVRTWAAANGYDIGTAGQGSGDNHPVRNVNWYEAVKWCNAKSEKDGLTPVYTLNGTTYKTGQRTPVISLAANGYRLPAEAEWRWAAMGGVQSQGYIYSGSNDLNSVGWYWDNSSGSEVNLFQGRGTWPVGKKAPNELGLYDMSGNVWEWCADPIGGSEQQICGGAWGHDSNRELLTDRDGDERNYSGEAHGFRYAFNAKGSATLQIDDVTKAYNGAPQDVTVRTTPENLKVNVNYNGTAQDGTVYQSSTPPTKVGTYTVNAEIDDPNYQGANSAMLVISKAQAQLNISGTQETYTGYYIPISISSNQSISGLSVNYSKVDPYSGSEQQQPTVIYSSGYQPGGSDAVYTYNINPSENLYPINATNAGIYNVSITSNDPNYDCSYNVQLFVAKANIDWLQVSSTTSSNFNGQQVSEVYNMQYIPVKFTETRPNSFPQKPVLKVTYTKWQNNYQTIGPVDYKWEGYMGGQWEYLPDGYYSTTPAGSYQVSVSTDDPNFDCNITGTLEVSKADRSSDYQMSATETRFTGSGVSPIFISRSSNYGSYLEDPQKIKITYYRHYHGGGIAPNPQNYYVGEVVYNATMNGFPYSQVNYVPTGGIYNLFPGDYMVSAEVDDENQRGWFSTFLTISKAQLDFQIAKTQQIYTGTYAPIELKILNFNQQLGQPPSSLRVDYSPKSVFENGQYVTRGESQSVIYMITSGQNPYASEFTYEPEQMSNPPTMVGEYNIRISYPYNPYNPGGGDPNSLFEEYSSLTTLVVAEPMVTVQGGTLPQNSAFAGQKVQAFQIGKLEVTWGEWKTIRDWATANGYSDLANVGEGSADNHPVRNVSWYDVVKWCNAKSEKEGLSPVYSMNGTTYKTGQSVTTQSASANGYRLPDEAEWEWAARGGISSKGYIYSGGNDLNAVAWWRDNSNGSSVDLGTGSGLPGRGTWPVGLKLSNELGIFDMCGNVLEWCSNDLSGQRVIQGSDWATYAADCVIGVSRSSQPTWVGSNAGFRLARNIGPKIAMNSTLPDALRNQPYGGYTFGVNEGSGVKVWSISEGSLPPGMSFSANGTLSGTPTTAGTYTFVIRLESGGYWDELEVELEVVTPINYAEMVTVQGGTLPAGSELAGQQVSNFQIGKYEVTWALWKEVREWAKMNGYDFPGHRENFSSSDWIPDIITQSGAGSASDHPVRNINWYEAIKWCNARSEKELLNPVYYSNGNIYRTLEYGKDGSDSITIDKNANGYRLPFDAEWEFAARGGIKSQNFIYPGGNELKSVAWQSLNSFNPDFSINGGSLGTWPVGLKLPNELGLYDMAGNIAEWCWDKDVKSYGTGRRQRGGSWGTDGKAVEVFQFKLRVMGWADRGDYGSGLRVARSLLSSTNR